MRTPRPCAASLIALPLMLLASSSLAADLWVPVQTGVDWLHRTTGGGTPQDIHAVRIDLSLGQVGLRASMNNAAERGVGTDTFATNVGALAAIGGDWSNGYTPVGLAIGNGFLWHDHYSDPNIGGTWGTFGCDVWNGCTIEALPPLPDVWWYRPLIAPLRYYNAVGTNGLLMLDDGVPSSGCFDGCSGDTCRNPRSMVCLEQGGGHLWFIAVDGRRTGASGMTCGEARALATDLGCWDAAMLDGGGSTALWVDGAIRNQPSDGSPRDLANHVGIVYTQTPDAACPFDAGAWCEGDQLRTCNGGRLVNEGNCAAFGTACQEDGDWAFCVSPQCPGGDGGGAACVGETGIESCTDGVYSTGDCAFFGAVCGTDASGSACMDSRCEAGPNTGFCVDADTVGTCTAGAYSEVLCDLGQHCEAGACVDDGDDDDDDDDDSAGDDDDSAIAGDDDDLTPPRLAPDEDAGSCSCHIDTIPAGSLAPLGLLVLGIAGRRQQRHGPRVVRESSS
jgi:hypothetical protein